jgi:hypothetical protein
VAYFTSKGADARLRAEGVERFRERVARLRPDLADRVGHLASMDEVFILDVKLNRLNRWYLDGLLLIGDAAHAMSQAGGVGINLAIQDAVAAATILAEPLRRHSVSLAGLAAVQRRRQRPTTIVQNDQRLLQRVMFKRQFAGERSGPPKSHLLLSRLLPGFRVIPARFIGFAPARNTHPPSAAARVRGRKAGHDGDRVQHRRSLTKGGMPARSARPWPAGSRAPRGGRGPRSRDGQQWAGLSQEHSRPRSSPLVGAAVLSWAGASTGVSRLNFASLTAMAFSTAVFGSPDR